MAGLLFRPRGDPCGLFPVPFAPSWRVTALSDSDSHMHSSLSAKQLVEKLTLGDPDAGDELYHRYSERLIALADKRMGQALRAHVTPEDIAHSALGSFFRRAATGDYEVDHSGALWRLLLTIVVNKIRRKARDCRETTVDDDGILQTLVADDSTAEEAASLAEEVERLLDGLDARYGELLRLRLEGYSILEISDRTQWSRWTVRRDLDRIGSRLRRRLDEQSAEAQK